MDKLVTPKLFGEMHIPKLTINQLTASFEVKRWDIQSSPLQINMYLSAPDKDEPIELPSITITQKELNVIPDIL